MAGPGPVVDRGEVRPGDWNCPSCGVNVYSTRCEESSVKSSEPRDGTPSAAIRRRLRSRRGTQHAPCRAPAA
eukprot:scaffold1532_cov120-Isochrysis_galbana.AAC.5